MRVGGGRVCRPDFFVREAAAGALGQLGIRRKRRAGPGLRPDPGSILSRHSSAGVPLMAAGRGSYNVLPLPAGCIALSRGAGAVGFRERG